MSAPGPESIPFSADPRSRRPAKRRSLSPTSSQAASLNALFAKPDQTIAVPASTPGRRKAHLPEIYSNVQGSSAGAGSGEFHVYKASRRREYERLKDMDEALRQEKERDEFERSRAERLGRDEEKTKKNRGRREKMKARKARRGGNNTGGCCSAGVESAVQSSTGHEPDSAVGEDTSTRDAAQPGGGTPSSDQAGLVIHDDD
ncbi:DUF1168 domain protein [Metarhizium rileyi]|uniref:DUF1168 domain protein n=1 Tax=Metarhizium rileyi (strain RCEF 4871) TaxID=1649241 RepID=A0A167GBE4_METRR|nr:DUF1168 domain protein [Metarhizium rileyi RCEF 4871]